MNKDNIIPKSFTLGGTTYTVNTVDNYLDGNNVAFISYPMASITIANQFKGEECTNDYKEASFLHELVHGMLHTIGKDELCSDEEFVEGLSNTLHQYIKTAKYE